VRRAEEGFSILEVLIAMVIGMVLLGLVMVSLSTFLQTGYDGVASGQANDNAALTMTLIRRQVVNADVLYNPASEGSNAGPTIPSGFSLRMLTAGARTTAPPETASGTITVPTCVQWRLLKTGKLEDRSWPTGRPTAVRPWRTVMSGLVNARPSTPPFALDMTGAYQHRVLKLTFVLPETVRATGTSLTLRSSVTALDAQFFAPTASQYCSPVPSP
jgi:type II secretory pathway pseudopilin PulG